jgi:hypothetical protein
MILRNVFLGCLFLSVAACNSEAKNGKITFGEDTLRKNTDSTSLASLISICDQTKISDSAYEIRSDTFVSNILKKELTSTYLDRIFKGSRKMIKLVKNNYIPNRFDTIVSYKVDCDSSEYISSKSNSFPLYLSVQSGRLALDSGFIKVGLSKDEFMRKLHLGKSIPNIIKITEIEGNNEFFFVFVNNALRRILYNNLYVE